MEENYKDFTIFTIPRTEILLYVKELVMHTAVNLGRSRPKLCCNYSVTIRLCGTAVHIPRDVDCNKGDRRQLPLNTSK